MRGLRVIALVVLGLLPACSRRKVEPYDGVVLFAPLHSNVTELRDAAHQTLHSWTTKYPPGQCVHLLDDGSLLRTVRLPDIGSPFQKTYSKGSGGGVEWLNWDGTQRWSFTYSNEEHLLHHDIERLPNGNLLMLAWVHIPFEESKALGCNTATETRPILSERIIEVDCHSSEIVWQWDAWDHTAQNVVEGLDNYVAGRVPMPKIDLNLKRDAADWLHFNALAYDPHQDLIVISVRQTSEIWIIDHSTTTEQAKLGTGGVRGVGGDIFARWGNDPDPEGERTLYHQHDANWIPDGYPGEGNLLLFNNGHDKDRRYSDILEVRFDVSTRSFDVVWQYDYPRKEAFYSQFVSSAQRLPDGHTLVCSGCQGWTFELDADGHVCWEHRYPVEDRLDWIFRVKKYDWPQQLRSGTIPSGSRLQAVARD